MTKKELMIELLDRYEQLEHFKKHKSETNKSNITLVELLIKKRELELKGML